MTDRSWGHATFDRLYAADPDPWQFTTSPYERDKYAATLGVLTPGRRFVDGLEVGCSIGVFTAQLALRCDRLLAVDFAAAALDAARRRCAELAQVRFEQRMIPAEWPEGRFDLIVLSEVLYFLDAGDIAETARRARASLRPGGFVLLANWTGPTNTPTTGDAAAALFHAAAGLGRVSGVTGETYRIDLLAAEAAAGTGRPLPNSSTATQPTAAINTSGSNASA